MNDNAIEMIIGKNNVYLAKSNLDITKIIELMIKISNKYEKDKKKSWFITS